MDSGPWLVNQCVSSVVHEGFDHFEKLKGVVFNFGFKIRVGLDLSGHVRGTKMTSSFLSLCGVLLRLNANLDFTP
jgi:hypothetical protein